MVYEVVCTKNYLDVGLLIEKTYHSKPKRVLARASTYSSDHEYGGVETLTWVNTGVFLSKEEWKNVSYNKATEEILNELGIVKKNYSGSVNTDQIDEIRMDNTMTEEKIIERRVAREILNMIERIYFSKEYQQYRIDNGSNGTRDLLIDSIKNLYEV